MAGTGSLPARSHLIQFTMRSEVGYGSQAVPRPGGHSSIQRVMSSRCHAVRAPASTAARSSK